MDLIQQDMPDFYAKSRQITALKHLLDSQGLSGILNLHLLRLKDFWLEIKCCHGSQFLPINLIAAHRKSMKLQTALGKLKCKQCGSAPWHISLNVDAKGNVGIQRSANRKFSNHS